MSRKLDLIKRILIDHPVTDPRGALMAIEKVLATKNPKPDNLLTLRLNQADSGRYQVAIKFNRKKLQGKHINVINNSIDRFAEDTFGPPCEDCNPIKEMVKGDRVATTVGELLKQFEADARNATRIDPKKGK